MELFDILNPDGSRTGSVRERGVVHRDGSLHGASHIWILRPGAAGGTELLLQRRSSCSDSSPGCCDISAAGHAVSGESGMQAAIRELHEELGIQAVPEQLRFIGTHRGSFEGEFYGKPFRDNELCSVYLYTEPVNISELTPRPSEVEEVFWMNLSDCRKAVLEKRLPAVSMRMNSIWLRNG